jgi:hypothetical protein
MSTYYRLGCGFLGCCNLLQCRGHFDVHLAEAVPFMSIWIIHLPLPFLRGHQLPSSKRSPRHNRHTLIFAHGDDVSFHVPVRCIPSTLVHRKRCEAVASSNCRIASACCQHGSKCIKRIKRTCICLDDHPGWSIGNTDVQHLLRHNVGVKMCHDFFH